MVRHWYFVEAADAAELENAPVFIVKVEILDGKKELIQNVVHVKNLSHIIRRNMCNLRLGNSLKSYYYVK